MPLPDQIHRISLRNLLWLLPCIPVLSSGCQSGPLPPTTGSVEQAGIREAHVLMGTPDDVSDRLVRQLAFNSERKSSSGGSPDDFLADNPTAVSESVEHAAGVDTAQDADPEADELSRLELLVQSANPRLIRLQREANAAAAKTQYVHRLPDPTIGTNVFGHPIETAAGGQRANLSLMQTVPWLDRLNAQQQQACFEAMALQQMYAAERLRMTRDLRVGYYRLYVLNRQILTVETSQQLLESLIEIINARVATGRASQGDVLLGTLELSRLYEQRITLQEQVRSTSAAVNRIVGRPVETPITVPNELAAPSPNWSHAMLVQAAWRHQPVIAVAQLQANASRWGVEVAELKRRPDFLVGATWFFIEGDRPPTGVVDVGRDAWSLGATVTVPLDGRKYDAIREEARWKNAASQPNVQDVKQEFEEKLLILLAKAQAADQTAALYRNTIIPQSEQTLAADQEALTDGTADFDRVIQDFRSLLQLEFEYHRAVGELATGIARIRQAVGMDIQPPTQSAGAATPADDLPAVDAAMRRSSLQNVMAAD